MSKAHQTSQPEKPPKLMDEVPQVFAVHKEANGYKFTRRDFIKTAGVAATSVALVGCEGVGQKGFRGIGLPAEVERIHPTITLRLRKQLHLPRLLHLLQLLPLSSISRLVQASAHMLTAYHLYRPRLMVDYWFHQVKMRLSSYGHYPKVLYARRLKDILIPLAWQLLTQKGNY
jgi:hypothetical protein